MAEVGRLSPSKITTYLGCSFAYFLHYIQHERVPTRLNLGFGKGVHFMLDKFYNTNFKSAESFGNYWKHYWLSYVAGDFLRGREKTDLVVREIPTKKGSIRVGNHVTWWGDDSQVLGAVFGYMKLVEDILRRFYERHKEQKPPIASEQGFGVRKDEIISLRGHEFRGVFDRIDTDEERWFITDYKTDKSSPENDAFTLHRHLQFTLYSWAFRQKYGKLEKAILYYHLRTGKVFKTHRSQQDYDYLARVCDIVAEGVDKGVFIPFYGYHCNFCDYKAPCERYSIDYHGGQKINLDTRIIGAEEFDEWELHTPQCMLSRESS